MNNDNELTGDDPSDDAYASDDLSQYLQMYVDETEEQLDDLVETMLVLEEYPHDDASLSAAFRLLHSMKGAAGMMGFDQITVLTHHLETRFERLRSGRIELDRVTMNLTLRCIDFLRQCNERLRQNADLATPDVLLKELRELEERTEHELAVESQRHVATDETQDTAVSDVRPREPTAEESTSPDVSISLDLGTDYHVVIHINAHVTLKEIKARSVASLLDDLGEIKATRPDLAELEEAHELLVFDVILFTEHSPQRIIEVALVDGVDAIDVRQPRDSEAPSIATSRDRPQAVAPSTSEPDGPETEGDSIAGKDPGEGSAQTDVPPESTSPKATGNKISETMRVDIDRLDQLMSLAGELVVNRAQFVQVAADIGIGLRRLRSVNRASDFRDTLTRTIERLRSGSREPSVEGDDWSSLIQELESGRETLEQQNAVWEESRRHFGRLDDAIDQLSRVSDSLQRGVLGTRMVPVGPLFNRFKRVVRDLCQDRNKQVALLLDGESTELDKRMIDALGDPLVHLVRNSIDHGMKSTDERIAAGKPAEGTVSLSAQHRGNHVYIVIQDDGGGIDDAKIRKRLVDRGILDQNTAAQLSRSEAIRYIWHPGFSTAEQVTDVSGRGVGMDIVRSRITELAGTIETESTLGVGTTFMLKLPLTLAIISSLMVRIRGIVFAIPKDDVREIVLIPDDEIISIQGTRTFEVRGQYVPLITVDELFDWNRPESEATEETAGTEDQHFDFSRTMTEIAILQSGDRMMGLKVDRSIGSQDVVIKSLSENFINIDGFAGASILGNGSVALMLDVAALLKMAIRENDRNGHRDRSGPVGLPIDAAGENPLVDGKAR